MAFRPVDARQSFPELEEQILERWRERDVFQRSLAQRADAEVWSFYEGPPTANGEPGSHHVLSRVFKDIYPRYRTMRGYRVPRKAGWDCHGLPVELAVEKELDIASKAEIEAYGIAEFNERCRESVFRYVEQWGRLTERVGFWIDLDDAYVTLANSYIESVWWSLRKVWDEGRLYQAQQGGAVLPARRDGALLARGGPGIPRRRGPLRLREAARAGCEAPARGRGRPVGLDDDPLDADHERGRGRWAGDRIRARSHRRRGADRGRAPRRAGPRRGRRGSRPLPRLGARRVAVRARPSTTSPTTGRAATRSSRPTS